MEGGVEKGLKEIQCNSACSCVCERESEGEGERKRESCFLTTMKTLSLGHPLLKNTPSTIAMTFTCFLILCFPFLCMSLSLSPFLSFVPSVLPSCSEALVWNPSCVHSTLPAARLPTKRWWVTAQPSPLGRHDDGFQDSSDSNPYCVVMSFPASAQLHHLTPEKRSGADVKLHKWRMVLVNMSA